MHAKRVCKDFEIENVGQYHVVHLKSDTFLLTENFRKMCVKIDHLDSAKLHSAPELAWIYDIAIRSFVDSIYTLKDSIVESEEDQSNLLKNIVEFKYKFRERKRDTYERASAH